MKRIDFDLLSAQAAFIYGVAGVSLIFCVLYIRNLEKTNKELLKNSQEMLDYLNGYDDDPDPDDGEKVIAGLEEKPKTNVVAFRPRKSAS